MKVFILSVALILGLAFSQPANAGFISNDESSNSVLPDTQRWNPQYKDGVWQGVYVWQGVHKEFWDLLYPNGKPSLYPSDKPVTSFNIFQTFVTAVGDNYDVGFTYEPEEKDLHGFLFEVLDANDNVIARKLVNDETVDDWSKLSIQFTATSLFTTIRLITITDNPIDDQNIKLFKTAANVASDSTDPIAVPEPKGVLLILLAMFTWLALRRLRVQ